MDTLTQMAEPLGVRVVNTDEAFTTMTCAACGAVRASPVTPGARHWTCEACGAVHDRYVNAACNILQRGLEIEELAT